MATLAIPYRSTRRARGRSFRIPSALLACLEYLAQEESNIEHARISVLDAHRLCLDLRAMALATSRASQIVHPTAIFYVSTDIESTVNHPKYVHCTNSQPINRKLQFAWPFLTWPFQPGAKFAFELTKTYKESLVESISPVLQPYESNGRA